MTGDRRERSAVQIRLRKAPLLAQLSLRPNQMKAIDGARRYVAAYKAGQTAKAGLVHMATGTGKTGVIATLARCIPEIGTTLVLAPRIALRDQLIHDIASRFFARLERAPRVLPKQVRDIEEVIRTETPQLGNSVFVTTVQMLETMNRPPASGSSREQRKRRLYRRLKEMVDLVLVDEGHYEPALSWAQAVRQIPAPRILFTATPYRNDLKSFDTDDRFASHFTLSEATAKRVVRRVRVIQRKPTREPREFMSDVLSFYDQRIRRRWTDARVIVRCDSDASIRQMAQILSDEGRSLLAIHETFSDRGGEHWERRTVPQRDKEPRFYEPDGPVFWIHQFKLLEGIDDDRFRLVALFEPLGNARQVVQQVGRIIRNPECPREAEAFLLDHAGGYHERYWKNLIAYDDVLASESADAPLIHEEFVTKVLQAHPDPTYFRGNVRRRFSFEDFNPTLDLSLPRAANLLHKGPSFDIGEVRSILERRLDEADCVYRRYPTDDKTLVFIYVAVDSAPFLPSVYFLSGMPGVTVVHELKSLVAYYDSGGGSLLGIAGRGGAIGSDQLRRLFSGGVGTKLVEAAMKNTQLGHRAARTRSLTAASIEETVPGLDDHVHVLTRVTGYSAEEVRDGEGGQRQRQLVTRRRYVGLRHGRVVESGERIDLDEYCAWLQELEAALADARRGLPTFGRYASHKKKVADPTARNVLLDVFEVLDSFRTTGDEERKTAARLPMEIEDLCQDVVRRRSPGGAIEHVFSVVANGHPCEVSIEFDSKRSRYKLRSPDLDRMYYRSDSGTGSLIKYLNDEQSFRVVPVSRDTVYVDGEFYEPVVRVGPRFNADQYHVGKILEPIDALEKLCDEKGAVCLADGSDWDRASLFGLISRLGRSDRTLEAAFGEPNILVCDDLGTEVADFILADSDRVVFIHAKAVGQLNPPKPYSASELSVVCAQAIKNVRYLSMFNDLTPKNLSRWEEPWQAAKTAGRVRRRIRLPKGRVSPEKLWDELRSRIANPRTHREVWLLLGGILSKARLERELARSAATAEAVQAVTLLHATLAAIGSIDAKLRIFCYP